MVATSVWSLVGFKEGPHSGCLRAMLQYSRPLLVVSHRCCHSLRPFFRICRLMYARDVKAWRQRLGSSAALLAHLSAVSFPITSVSWYPPNVDLDVVSTLEDVVEVSNDLGGEVLSWCWSRGGAFSDGCLVVDEDPDGIRAFVVWVPGPLLSIGGCL